MGATLIENNQVTLKGKVASKPELNHEKYGEKFYIFQMEVKRTSGTIDSIPIIVSEYMPFLPKISVGSKICVNGRYRSYNKVTEGKSKLILTVYAAEITSISENEQDYNKVILEGFICKDVISRKTPRGRKISDIILAVNRSYGKTDYIPCIAWGKDAYIAANLEVGDKINITGRIQSREYEKVLPDGTKEKRIAYEVSVNELKE